MALEPQQLLEMYRKMATIRRFDQRAVEEFQTGNIPGGVHAYIGQEAVAVYEAAEQAVRRARDGVGPALIECKTYRWRAHSEQRGNPSDPRPGNEIAMALQHDPIASFGSRLIEQGVATAARLQQIDAEVRAAVEEAVAFAQASPLPRSEDALLDVFAP